MSEKPDDNAVPRFLFRYRAFLDKYDSLRRILVHNQWYFGSRLDFDDQDDCKLPGVLVRRKHLRRLMAEKDGSLTKAREQEIERLLKNPESEHHLTEEVQGYINRVGILCLSESADDPDLWALYAEGGHGVCLVLDTLEVAAQYVDRGPFEVRYSDDPKLPWDPRGSKSYQIAQTEDHLCRKATKWQSQKEWRFILHKDREPTVGYHPMPSAALRSIILGDKLAQWERDEVLTWLSWGPFRNALKIGRPTP